MPDPAALPPLAVTVRDASPPHAPVAPETVGAAGGPVRSMRTLPVPPLVAVLHPLTLPAASVARNWTRVSPSAVTFTDEPVRGEVYAPPLKDVRYWTVET